MRKSSPMKPHNLHQPENYTVGMKVERKKSKEEVNSRSYALNHANYMHNHRAIQNERRQDDIIENISLMKRHNPGSFSIPVYLENLIAYNALCDLGVSCNVFHILFSRNWDWAN